MIREIVGASAVANWIMPNKKKKKMSNITLGMIGTTATIAGIGAAAYMMMKTRNREEAAE